jgi:hypothetical protein
LSRFYILIFLFLIPLTGQKYLWPTNASRNLTSVFGEFRPRHYHSGIDIKTWAKTGYEVYAVEEGEVMRVRVSPFGYGKALYVRLKDGNYAVYAHLERFNDKIEKMVRKIQRKKGRYSIQFYPSAGKIKVKKGEIIAWSGDTGIGVPHLHFEIRNSRNQPMNPLLFYPRLKDDIAPQFSRIAVIPLADTAFVAGSPFPVIYKSRRLKGNNYVINEAIPVDGKIALAFVAWDAANGVRNRFSVYRFELFREDSLIFSARYDYLDFEDTRFIELDRNFSLIREKKGKFQQAWLHRFNELPFYRTDADSGAIELKPGEKAEFKLKIYDFNGNSSTLKIDLIGAPALELSPHAVNEKGDICLMNLGEWGRFDDLKAEPLTQSATAPRILLNGDGEWRLQCGGDLYMTELLALNGSLRLPLYFARSGELINEKTVIRIEKDILRGRLVFRKGIPPKYHPVVKFNGKRILPRLSYEKNILSFAVKLPRSDGKIDLLLDGREGETESLFSQDAYYVSRSKKYNLKKDGIEIFLPENALYDPAFVYWNVESSLNYEIAEGRFYSGVYSVEPFLQPLDHGAQISLFLPEKEKRNEHIGLFFYSDKGKWIFLGANEDGKCRSKVLSMERFALISDTVEPVIESITLARKKKFSKKPKKFKWRVVDEGSGFPGDENFSCALDGETVIIEFDPEEDLLILPTFDLPINKGKHIFVISAEDNLRNKTVAKFEFFLK